MTDMLLPGDLDVASAREFCDRLQSWLGQKTASDAAASLEVSDTDATQIALQLLFATARSAKDEGIDMTFGPNATALLDKASA